MVYTVTLNPSLDYAVIIDSFTTGMVNRTLSEKIFPGGKGINVSSVLGNLGIPSVILGFTGGFTGEEIEKSLKLAGRQCDFTHVKSGNSRINVKIVTTNDTEINAGGPAIDGGELSEFLQKIDMLTEGDMLVLAGSVPSSVPDTIYADIMRRVQKKNIDVIVDAEKKLVYQVLQYHPFLIKPNVYELAEYFETDITTVSDIKKYALKLQQCGARNVLVSMGGDGAVLCAENGKVFYQPSPEGKVISAVGSGDSMVAGFIYGYEVTGEYEDAFYYSVAAGSASAFTSGLAKKEEIHNLYKNMTKREE